MRARWLLHGTDERRTSRRGENKLSARQEHVHALYSHCTGAACMGNARGFADGWAKGKKIDKQYWLLILAPPMTRRPPLYRSRSSRRTLYYIPSTRHRCHHVTSKRYSPSPNHSCIIQGGGASVTAGGSLLPKNPTSLASQRKILYDDRDAAARILYNLQYNIIISYLLVIL